MSVYILRRLVVVCALCLMVSGMVTRAQPEPILIIGTTTQAADLVRILTDGVSQDAVQVIGLMGAGVDPHLYKPTEADIAAMNRARMVIYSGLGLEGQFDTVFRALGERGVHVMALGDPVKNAGYVMDVLDEAGVDDPHFWFDPRNWQMTTFELADALARLDPTHADLYLANADAYSAQLDLLYDWALEAMTQVPEPLRYIVTSHDAFQYFGAAFGWEMYAIQGISTADEAGVGDIQSTVSFIVENRIPVVFVESSVPPTTIQAVQEAVRAGGGLVEIGIRELYSDAMGDPDTFGGTYIGMIAENVYTILQSYQQAGVELVIPEWHEDLFPAPPVELLELE